MNNVFDFTERFDLLGFPGQFTEKVVNGFTFRFEFTFQIVSQLTIIAIFSIELFEFGLA